MKNTYLIEYNPEDYESEKASNSYLMSMISIVVGLPLPIVNLIATLIFFLGNRSESYFIRWHCTQALLSQLLMFFVNSSMFWWTISVVFTDEKATLKYFIALTLVFIYNLLEFIITIFAAIRTRKGEHVHWFLFGDLANILCKNRTK